MSHKMVAPHNVTGFSVEGSEYTNDPNGMVEVQDHHVETAQVHGYRLATLDEEARFQNVSVLTPIVVSSMTRDQMQAFIESREMKVPARTADMRALVQRIADDEQDKEAKVELAEAKAEAKEEAKAVEAEEHPSRARLKKE